MKTDLNVGDQVKILFSSPYVLAANSRVWAALGVGFFLRKRNLAYANSAALSEVLRAITFSDIKMLVCLGQTSVRGNVLPACIVCRRFHPVVLTADPDIGVKRSTSLEMMRVHTISTNSGYRCTAVVQHERSGSGWLLTFRFRAK
ncbi:hypothetical protein [Hylemonella gracilis]|uniref:hypothetical protein n=1 Tax=Hylemonella gracilis TaxID=80880 RepID=UPI00111096B0|nr:hypothetical protein [Hylemonella gracilis]